MEAKPKRLFSNLSTWNWQNVILLALMTFYLTNFGFRVATQKFPYYATDFLAYWSVGKIADVSGFSHIYDLDNLRAVESKEMINLGLIEGKEDTKFLTIPAPYLAIFIVPFQFLSHIDIQTSCSIWLIINLLILIGYFLFFFKDLQIMGFVNARGYSLFLLLLFSYPVFDNFLEGQINVILLICTGEFIRNAIKGRSLAAGIWLSGLLLKPQLLVLLVPVLLISGEWKTLKGFFAGFALIFTSSWILSGTRGLKELFFLLAGYSQGMATNSPQYMINWRMAGTLLNQWTNSNFGWIVTGLGTLATLAVVIYLVKDRPNLGSNEWLMGMVGVFSATLAVTWHAHNHMAMVMIPLLIAAFASKILQKKTLWVWILIPVIGWMGAGALGVILHQTRSAVQVDLLGIAIPLGAFLGNLWLLVAVFRWKKDETGYRSRLPKVIE